MAVPERVIATVREKIEKPVVTGFLNGSRSWTRTNDPLINSQLLYRLSYPGPVRVDFF